MSETRRGGYCQGRVRRRRSSTRERPVSAQGFHGTVAVSIATRVGLSEPGFLPPLPSKETLAARPARVRTDHESTMLAPRASSPRGLPTQTRSAAREVPTRTRTRPALVGCSRSRGRESVATTTRAQRGDGSTALPQPPRERFARASRNEQRGSAGSRGIDPRARQNYRDVLRHPDPVAARPAARFDMSRY